jgi:hypothetical protein
MTACRLIFVALFVSLAGTAQEYVISTIAGGVPPPTPVVGNNASIGETGAVATDAAGNLYFPSFT